MTIMRPLDFICGACHEEIKLKEFTILLCGHLLCASCAGESMQTMNGYQQMQCRCGIQTCFRVQQPEFVAKKQMQDGEIDMAIYTECRGQMEKNNVDWETKTPENTRKISNNNYKNQFKSKSVNKQFFRSSSRLEEINSIKCESTNSAYTQILKQLISLRTRYKEDVSNVNRQYNQKLKEIEQKFRKVQKKIKRYLSDRVLKEFEEQELGDNLIKLRQKYDKAVGAQLQRIKQGLERDSHYMEAYCIKDNRADRQSKSLSSQRDNMGSTFDKQNEQFGLNLSRQKQRKSYRRVTNTANQSIKRFVKGCKGEIKKTSRLRGNIACLNRQTVI